MIALYTLPNCPICHMVKTKLEQKQIKYEEKDFSSIAALINTDYAPILYTEKEYLNSPSKIVQWINEWEG